MAADECVGVAVSAQLRAHQVERAVETGRAAIERERVVAVAVVGRVPEPRVGDQAAHADLLGGVGDGRRRMRRAGLEEAGRAVADHLEAGEHRARVLCLVVDGVQERHEEAGLDVAKRHRVAERAPREVEGDVRVALDEAGMHDRAARVDDAVGPVLLEDRRRRADGHDVTAVDRDGAVGVDVAVVVHRQDVAVRDDEIDARRAGHVLRPFRSNDNLDAVQKRPGRDCSPGRAVRG